MPTTKIPNVTEKNTKTEILSALKTALQVIDDSNKITLNPAAEAAKEKEKAIIADASIIAQDESIERVIANLRGLVDNAITDLNQNVATKTNEFKTLCEAIELKKSELEDLLEIEVNINTLAALVNSKIAIQQKFDAEQAVKMEKATADLQATKDAIAKLYADYEADIRTKKAEAEKQRKREEEEYKYNFERNKKLDKDAWEDEKAKRTKDLDTRQADLDKREIEIKDKEGFVANLVKQVEAIPAVVEVAKKEAAKEAEDKAKTAYGFETRYLKRDYEAKIELLETKVDNLESTIESKNDEIGDLKEKLNDAYAEIKEMAAKVVDGANDRKMAAAYERFAADSKSTPTK